MKIDFDQDELLTVRRLATHLETTEAIVKLMIADNTLASVKVAQTKYVPRSEVDRWKASGATLPIIPPEPKPERQRWIGQDEARAIVARRELDSMADGSWALPEGWTEADHQLHHDELTKVVTSGGKEGYLNVVRAREKARAEGHKQFWQGIEDLFWIAPIWARAEAGVNAKGTPLDADGQRKALARAQWWIDHAFLFNTGMESIDVEFYRIAGVPSRYCASCFDHPREPVDQALFEYWSTPEARDAVLLLHRWDHHEGRWRAARRGESRPDVDPNVLGYRFEF